MSIRDGIVRRCSVQHRAHAPFQEIHMVQAVNPYLNFPGNTLEAFEFYRSVFGGEFAMVLRYRDFPDNIELPPMRPTGSPTWRCRSGRPC